MPRKTMCDIVLGALVRFVLLAGPLLGALAARLLFG